LDAIVSGLFWWQAGDERVTNQPTTTEVSSSSAAGGSQQNELVALSKTQKVGIRSTPAPSACCAQILPRWWCRADALSDVLRRWEKWRPILPQRSYNVAHCH
jgi:hypothetical protein